MAVRREDVEKTIKRNQAVIKSANKQSERLTKSASSSKRIADRMSRARQRRANRSGD